ncbi:LysR family transcriptional regulator [Arthrobacter sp. 24S4-2]|uniref:LysR family transcriptional regulator n=1 Tax=Arthrobacter sp. 24S4-2 TaxID=2575374 RepID=UPI00158671FC|nr:LysR family transcriptional regulator [Arthrobacter sp. 24S4-2]
MKDIELRHLIAFTEVARTRSFTAAAESMGFTQSAMSQQIRRLERVLGHRLIDRSGGRTVTLTEAGTVLLGHAEGIQSRLESAIDDLASLTNGDLGVLRIGCYESVSTRVIPKVLKEFALRFPRIQVLLTESDDDDELLRMVETGDLHMTFIVFPLIDGPFEAATLLEDPLVLVVPENSTICEEQSEVSVDDLSGMPLIAYGKMRPEHQLETRLGRPHLSKQVIFRSNHNETILSLVAEGYAPAILTCLSVDPLRPGLRSLPITDVNPRIIGMAWHQQRPRAAAALAFVDIASEVARQIRT